MGGHSDGSTDQELRVDFFAFKRLYRANLKRTDPERLNDEDELGIGAEDGYCPDCEHTATWRKNGTPQCHGGCTPGELIAALTDWVNEMDDVLSNIEAQTADTVSQPTCDGCGRDGFRSGC